MNSGEDSFTLQSEEPAVTQSEEPAVTQSEEPALTQSEELTRAPEPIHQFLFSQLHASSDSGSQLSMGSLKQSKRQRTPATNKVRITNATLTAEFLNSEKVLHLFPQGKLTGSLPDTMSSNIALIY